MDFLYYLFNLILQFITLIFSIFLSSSSSASSIYADYLNGDPNFILVDGHMSTAWYVDRTSLVVQQYAPPKYIIAVNVITVNNYERGNRTISKVTTMRFLYNWQTKNMFIDRALNNNWRYLRANGPWSETGIVMPAGEMAFYLAYNMKFYGNYTSNFYQRAH